jgi:hypothetical protein
MLLDVDSGELSGEQSEELSDEHPMLEMTNEEGLIAEKPKGRSQNEDSEPSLPALEFGNWGLFGICGLGLGACLARALVATQACGAPFGAPQ